MMFSEDQLHMEGMLCDKKAVQLLPAPEGGLALRALSLQEKKTILRLHAGEATGTRVGQQSQHSLH